MKLYNVWETVLVSVTQPFALNLKVTGFAQVAYNVLFDDNVTCEPESTPLVDDELVPQPLKSHSPV